MTPTDKFDRHTYSYLALRQSIGWIGFLLPFVLMLGNILIFQGEIIEPSISDYYHTQMRNLFVGALCAVALFMFFYSGHDSWDNWLGNFAGLFAIGVAFFPTDLPQQDTWVGSMHLFCAASFFLLLVVFSLFLFTRTREGKKAEGSKRTRNIVYIVCGAAMLLCVIVMGLYFALVPPAERSSILVFSAETIALVFFGVSWLIKGGFMLADGETVNISGR